MVAPAVMRRGRRSRDSRVFTACCRKKEIKMIVHKDMPHGYLCHGELHKYDLYIKEISDLVQELIEGEETQQP